MNQTLQLLRLVVEGFRLNIVRLKLYSGSYWLEMLGNIIYVCSILIFWNVIYGRFPAEEKLGWSKEEMFIFLGFAELFFAVKLGFFTLSGRFWQIIFSGQIDVYLSRPTHPFVLFTINNMNLQFLISSIPMVIFLFWSGRNAIELSSFLIGLIVMFVGALLFMLLEFTLSCLGFWFGKVKSIEEILDSFMELNKFPLTMLGAGWKSLFTLILPFMYFATIPGIITSTEKSIDSLLFLQIAVVIFIWIFIIRSVWKKGRERYEGFGS